MDLSTINFSVSLEQLAYILIMTLIIGSIIKTVISFFKKFDVSNIPNEINSIVDKCYALFPIESFNFNGEIFKRGMKVQITTVDSRKIEGEIIGANTENVICLLTPQYIITREITRITAIRSIE